MQEVEAKRKLTPADGAHVFSTLIFLVGAYLVKTNYNTDCGADLAVGLDVIFYGLLLWMTYLLITLVPRYKNQGLRFFFNLLDLLYALFHLSMFIYNVVELSSEENDCAQKAPQLQFYILLYTVVIGMTLSVVFLGFIIWVVKRCLRPNDLSFHQADL
mmetsp:Transcript_11434/g.13107  ORF Transcript_11434/g.13107 Transcript_11434/m.13107 type:complete len:158 (+) Transcript_11434:25-498(+)